MSPVPGARVLLGPHAGYTYSGARLAETFAAWDTSKVRRVFILGPSHHVYFRNKALTSRYSVYQTPLGDLPVDTEVCAKLCESALGAFGYMLLGVDDEEHSFEMHAPFILHRAQQDSVEVKIVPIMISSLGSGLREKIVEELAPYFGDPQNTFVVLSDFCHWGRRFGYTEYVPGDDLAHLAAYSESRKGANAIWQSIEFLDRRAMAVAQKGSLKAWDEYIERTGNTICGQKPVGVVLKLLEHSNLHSSSLANESANGSTSADGSASADGKSSTNSSASKSGAKTSAKGFTWIGYSQSSRVKDPLDLSVLYASGYVVV